MAFYSPFSSNRKVGMILTWLCYRHFSLNNTAHKNGHDGGIPVITTSLHMHGIRNSSLDVISKLIKYISQRERSYFINISWELIRFTWLPWFSKCSRAFHLSKAVLFWFFTSHKLMYTLLAFLFSCLPECHILSIILISSV